MFTLVFQRCLPFAVVNACLVFMWEDLFVRYYSLLLFLARLVHKHTLHEFPPSADFIGLRPLTTSLSATALSSRDGFVLYHEDTRVACAHPSYRTCETWLRTNCEEEVGV